jgi:endonuclease/exonuclease/phosphatase family metal-dependent hydrolase
MRAFTMRFMLYNIRYGTGGDHRIPGLSYLRRTERNLDTIVDFISPLDPDVIGLVEIDTGSFRSGRRNQAAVIADKLGYYHSTMSKYAEDSFANRLPILQKQGNAFVTRDSFTHERFHYFEKGMKRLVIELEFDDLVVFLVHLALSSRVRHRQLRELYELVRHTRKPLLVAGDFNALWGDHEVELFRVATGLSNANTNAQPTFPSWAPRRQLDFIFHSSAITIDRFRIPSVQYSDHLPLVCDFHR